MRDGAPGATRADPAGGIRIDALARYLAEVLGGPVTVEACRPLGGPGDRADPKAFGYGTPLVVEAVAGGARRALVVARTRPTEGFGHDYLADRAWQALYAHGAYNGFPRHVRSLDWGFVRAGGELVRGGDAVEFFQLVELAGGTLYRHDLERLLAAPARPLDRERVDALARFLAEAHARRRRAPALYERRIRELVGHGECLMGILDSYPHPWPFLPPEACEAVERDAVTWRWRLRGRTHRLALTHGDFHPWNLLFREGTDFSVLDRSRGEWGEPADDVAALGVNYLFFALRRADARGEPAAGTELWALFRRFVDAYLAASGDGELLEVLPPFLAFRALVIAHPRWYPDLSVPVRAALVRMARGLMAGGALEPAGVAGLLEGLP